MVTGDNLQTARAIALECGILDDLNVSEPVIIEGKTFRALSDLEREEAAEVGPTRQQVERVDVAGVFWTI